ncbi:putative nucleotidyltransferase [Belliella baltica DSM 15883]|uniref:Putative nucleotidyltransferase n=1 Tax=Belliella baltica (strain DSM 15883 / CIP 108006 / LMG 21964 / BA134) TaxID=866536 RepID=I3Z480_BELBD|nr:nucleotidyltransferase domain-containing protein [Belliella baltica]AFL84048.1 putative nucleotidyltransferase [Belliella baltica DSM 15883]
MISSTEITNSGLTEEEIQNIQDIFSQYNSVEQVLLYGSRAIGSFKPASDIDLCMKGINLNLTIQQEIETDLDDLLLPYKIDLSIYHKITNPNFKEHIDRVGKELYTKT